jgi:hypothetical protein
MASISWHGGNLQVPDHSQGVGYRAQVVLRATIRPHPTKRQRTQPEQLLVSQFRATGEGWQTRIDAALRQFIAEHPLAR